jgi:hypothetical protein
LKTDKITLIIDTYKKRKRNGKQSGKNLQDYEVFQILDFELAAFVFLWIHDRSVCRTTATRTKSRRAD